MLSNKGGGGGGGKGGERDFLKVFYFGLEHNYSKGFERGPPKEHSCEIW